MLWQAFGRWGGLVEEAVGTGTPSFEGSGGLADNEGPLSEDPVNVPYPAGLQANDIAFIHAIINDFSGPHSLSVPAGWTEVDRELVGGLDAGQHGVFWKRLTGSESGTVTITAGAGYSSSDSFGGIMSIWRGCTTSGTPYESHANNSGDSSNMNGAAVTTTGANRTILHFGGTRGSRTATPASGYTEVYDLTSTAGDVNLGLKLYSIERASAGTQSSATHTISLSGRWQTMALALIPA